MHYSPLVRSFYNIEASKLRTVFALPTEKSICLFGNTYENGRSNKETTEFNDGHRIITGDLTSFTMMYATTERTIYTLFDIHPEYFKWFKEQGFDISSIETIYS